MRLNNFHWFCWADAEKDVICGCEQIQEALDEIYIGDQEQKNMVQNKAARKWLDTSAEYAHVHYFIVKNTASQLTRLWF